MNIKDVNRPKVTCVNY